MPVKIGPSQEETGAAGPNSARTEMPHRRDQRRREPTRSTTTDARRTTIGPLNPAGPRVDDPIKAPGLDQPDAKDETRERAPLGQAPQRIDPAPYHQPLRAHLYRPHEPDSAIRHRGGARKRALDGEDPSAAKRPDGLTIWPRRQGRSRSEEYEPCLCAVGGGERVDHRRRPSLRRLVMSAFGPPPAPLRSALSGGQPAPAGAADIRRKQVNIPREGKARSIERLPDGMLEKCATACHGHES